MAQDYSEIADQIADTFKRAGVPALTDDQRLVLLGALIPYLQQSQAGGEKEERRRFEERVAGAIAAAPKPEQKPIWRSVATPPDYDPNTVAPPWVMWWADVASSPRPVPAHLIGSRECLKGHWCWVSDLPKPEGGAS